MRIGMMLRTLDERQGIGVYTRFLVEELLAIDRNNHYLLFYRNPSNLGRFAHYPNVTERVVKSVNKALWDQVAIPLACWQEKVDVVFHPKFTVPLLAPCKTVMVLHGADWFIPEHAKYYKALDVKYIKLMMPLYCRRASAIVSVSQLTTDNFNRILKLPPGKVKTVYFGAAKHFGPVEDRMILQKIRDRYNLPDQFILTLSKYGGGNRKNIGQIFKAYQKYHGETRHKLVVGGKDCYKFKSDYGIPEDGFGGDILFPGWIDQKDLPAFYTLADLYLYPSNLEAFPIPITEARACGTPIVTSNVNGLEEIAGDAALLVNPDDPDEIAAAMSRVLSDLNLQKTLAARGLQRSKLFSWGKCARETLEIIQGLSSNGTGHGRSEVHSSRSNS